MIIYVHGPGHEHDRVDGPDGKEIRSVHVDTTNGEKVTIECGGEPIVIDKVYGPTIACAVRVRFDSKNVEWVVERHQTWDPEDSDGRVFASSSDWREVVRFRAQGDPLARLVEVVS